MGMGLAATEGKSRISYTGVLTKLFSPLEKRGSLGTFCTFQTWPLKKGTVFTIDRLWLLLGLMQVGGAAHVLVHVWVLTGLWLGLLRHRLVGLCWLWQWQGSVA